MLSTGVLSTDHQYPEAILSQPGQAHVSEEEDEAEEEEDGMGEPFKSPRGEEEWEGPREQGGEGGGPEPSRGRLFGGSSYWQHYGGTSPHRWVPKGTPHSPGKEPKQQQQQPRSRSRPATEPPP
jgi:hypothetical protein